MVGGHPREVLEASFDVTQEDLSIGHLCEAETVLVACQALALLPCKSVAAFSFPTTTPLWYLRLNHTRLADSILDLLGIPAKDSTRRAALSILSRFTSPSPQSLSHYVAAKKVGLGRRQPFNKTDQLKQLGILIDEAVALYGMSRSAAQRLRSFVESCLPLPPELNESIESLKKAITMIRSHDSGEIDPRRLKRFEEAAKSLRSIKDLGSLLSSLKADPLTTRHEPCNNGSMSRPLFISLDLGLRQRRKHYHGGIIFQCITLPEDFFEDLNPDETNEVIISQNGRGIRVAEGGNFSDLVRRHRPPGNFATVLVNSYTAAPIPACAGVRIAVGKLTELIYLDATAYRRNPSDTWSDSIQKLSDKHGIQLLRQSLAHPFSYAESVKVVVVSVNGMDTASCRERFIVASRLWAEGISAEYLPQSGIMLSLLKRLREDASDSAGASDWSLQELFGVCAILNIPFVVIVQPHLFSKGSVRLRRYPYDSLSPGQGSSTSSNEIFVSLNDLASTILGDTDLLEEGNEEQVEGNAASSSSKKDTRVECIFIDNDQYFGNDRELGKNETPHWKTYMKAMKGITLSAESYLSSLQDSSSTLAPGMPGLPVFAAADVSFWALRDFGTALMRREAKEQSAVGASNETIERHPKYKRVLKTLASAIDNYMRRHGLWTGNTVNHHSGGGISSSFHGQRRTSGSTSLLTILLYSKSDDRFDLVTLECHSGQNGSSKRK